MTDFWLRMAIAVPTIIGIWALFGDGMILGWLGDIWDKRLPVMFQKPLYSCPPCMSSVWGSVIWFTLGGDVGAMWILFLLSLVGILKLCVHNLLK